MRKEGVAQLLIWTGVDWQFLYLLAEPYTAENGEQTGVLGERSR